MQNRFLLEQRVKMSDHGTMEKKVCELLENETRLQREIDELKQERDKKIVDNQRNVEREREIFKGRLNESEQKCKELESKRSSQMFELDKERAKWCLERDHLVAQKQEVQEQLERMQRKQEMLLRENEKLKNERTNRKQMMYGQSGITNTSGIPSGAGYASKFTPQMFGSTLAKGLTSKENMVSSSQAFPSGFSKFISDGSSLQNEKPDPQQLPLASKDSNSKLLQQLGSPNAMQILPTKNKTGSVSGGSSGAGSLKYGMKGGSSTDETGSNI